MPKLSSLPTYVYIDGSNIRFAVLRTLGFRINYKKLYTYLAQKYPKLKRAVYMEGRSSDDKVKLGIFRKYERYGYEVLSLDRKSYTVPAITKKFKCKKCKTINEVEAMPESVNMKSNVDVYLCSEMMFDALNSQKPAHFIIMSCDGDYAEMIKKILDKHPDHFVSVLATPYVKGNNFLSSRLQTLRKKYKNYFLINIDTIRGKIK